MIRAVLRRPAALGRDARGAALIEFALVLPVLVLLYCGGYQLMDALSVQRKVTATVHTLADLTTQSTTLTRSQANDILAASTQVMAPYSTTPATVRITQIEIPANKKAFVSWSVSPNGTALAKGAAIDVPDDIEQANTWLIYSEMTYNYVPMFAPRVLGTVTFGDRIYMAPRNSASVTLN